MRFAAFFLAVYFLYRCLKNYKWQNALLLIASYLFYSFWDWRFLSLILVSTLVNYYCGLKIGSVTDARMRKRFFIISICFNLGMLGFFKYSNFFIDSLRILLSSLGLNFGVGTLNIVLPLGISFYTFQVMSYPIDIYWRVIGPTRSLSNFALFVSFFPLIISGPIERARNLLPQIARARKITAGMFYEGSWLIFRGLYKKILIADSLGRIIRGVFDTTADLPGSAILVGTYIFVFQLYADFSGYSDMARGICRIMGFDVMLNFRNPFFSKNMYDFWQRWHISLTTWIKEYVFYPLALSKIYGMQLASSVAILVTWALMGLWHGDAAKFIVWGLYQGAVLVIYSKLRPFLNAVTPRTRALKTCWSILQAVVVFNIFSLGILAFSCASMAQVADALKGIFFRMNQPYKFDPALILAAVVYLAPLAVMEFFQYRHNDDTYELKWPLLMRCVLYYILFYSIILYGDFGAQRYYYFQF